MYKGEVFKKRKRYIIITKSYKIHTWTISNEELLGYSHVDTSNIKLNFFSGWGGYFKIIQLTVRNVWFVLLFHCQIDAEDLNFMSRQVLTINILELRWRKNPTKQKFCRV